MTTKAEFCGHLSGLARCADGWTSVFSSMVVQFGEDADEHGQARACVDQLRARVDALAALFAKPASPVAVPSKAPNEAAIAAFRARYARDRAEEMEDSRWRAWLDTLTREEFLGLIEVGVE